MSKLTMKRFFQAGALASLLAVAAVSSHAQPFGRHGGGPGMEGGPHMEHMLELVDASDAQRAQIKQIMDAARADIKPQRDTLQQLHQQGMALLTAPTVDANAVEALRVQSQAPREQIGRRMSQALVAAANVLTPEQRSKLGARMAKMQSRMAERHKARGN